MSEALLKTNSTRDFKIMFPANDKGKQKRKTLHETVLVIIVVNFVHALVP